MAERLFSTRLVELRDSKKYSQVELSRIISVSRQTIVRWEASDTYPDVITLKKLAHALNTSVAYLMGETDDSSPIPTFISTSQEPAQELSEQLTEPLPQPNKLKAPADIINEIACINAEIGKSANLFTPSEVQAAETLLHCCLENFAADEGASPKQKAAS